jgi:hypothetical protein
MSKRALAFGVVRTNSSCRGRFTQSAVGFTQNSTVKSSLPIQWLGMGALRVPETLAEPSSYPARVVLTVTDTVESVVSPVTVTSPEPSIVAVPAETLAVHTKAASWFVI